MCGFYQWECMLSIAFMIFLTWYYPLAIWLLTPTAYETLKLEARTQKSYLMCELFSTNTNMEILENVAPPAPVRERREISWCYQWSTGALEHVSPWCFTETGLELSVLSSLHLIIILHSTLSLHELGKWVHTALHYTLHCTVLTEKNRVRLNEMIATNWLVNGKMS